MKAMNKMEEKVLKMIAEGKTLHGYAREIWIEMLLREEEKKNERGLKS